jgi:hypothetical protein
MNHKTERLLPEKTHDQMISEWMAVSVFKAEYPVICKHLINNAPRLLGFNVIWICETSCDN